MARVKCFPGFLMHSYPKYVEGPAGRTGRLHDICNKAAQTSLHFVCIASSGVKFAAR